ncbi:MAG: zinc-binding dehydrogenase, partial [Myxococcales bacterium]|nr:zinc-binding dehydrogenase [Myxococcales bacterium]
PNANQLPTNLIMMKGLDVLGCPTAIATHTDPSIRKARLDAILAWVREGKLTPVAGPEYDLEDVRTAMADKWASRHVGGCTLVMRS